jgi:hypothetical protein
LSKDRFKSEEQAKAWIRKNVTKGGKEKMEVEKKVIEEMQKKCSEMKDKMAEEGEDKYGSAIDEILKKITELLDLEKAEQTDKEEGEAEGEAEGEEGEGEKSEAKGKDEGEGEGEGDEPPATIPDEKKKLKAEESDKMAKLEAKVALLESAAAMVKKEAEVSALLKKTNLPSEFKAKIKSSLVEKTLKEVEKEIKEFDEYFKKHSFREVSLPEKIVETGETHAIADAVSSAIEK